MIGVLFQAVATFFEEISGSLEKWMVERRVESFYAVGFQNTVLSMAAYLAYVVFGPGRFVIHPDSIPSLVVLVMLSVAQAYATMKGTAVSSRSTFNFIRTGTMPLLLLADLVLGYVISSRQIVGIVLIVLALVFLFMNHGIERKGAGLVAFTAVNAALTISIYKWHITRWNSIGAEQIVLHASIGLFFLYGAIRFNRENPLRLMFRRMPMAQSATYAIGSFVEGFAYQYAPASIILAAKRSFSVLWAIIFGNRLFHEKHLALKLVTFALVASGILLLIR